MFYYDSDHRKTDSPPKAKTYKQLIIYHQENTQTSEVSVKFQSDRACDYVTTGCLSSKKVQSWKITKSRRRRRGHSQVFDRGHLRRHTCRRLPRNVCSSHCTCSQLSCRLIYSKCQHEGAGRSSWNWRIDPLQELQSNRETGSPLLSVFSELRRVRGQVDVNSEASVLLERLKKGISQQDLFLGQCWYETMCRPFPKMSKKSDCTYFNGFNGKDIEYQTLVSADTQYILILGSGTRVRVRAKG